MCCCVICTALCTDHFICARASWWAPGVSQHAGFRPHPLMALKENWPEDMICKHSHTWSWQEHFSESRVIVVISAINLGEKKKQEVTFGQGNSPCPQSWREECGENAPPLVVQALLAEDPSGTLHSKPWRCFSRHLLPSGGDHSPAKVGAVWEPGWCESIRWSLSGL